MQFWLLKKSLPVKGYSARKMLNEFPVKGWKWGRIDSLLKKILLLLFSKPEGE